MAEEQGTPAWVMATVRPATVSTAERCRLEPLAVAERLMAAEPEPEVAEVMDSHAESLEADQEQPACAVRLTDAVPPLAGRFKLAASKRYVQAVVNDQREDVAEPLVFRAATCQ